MGTTADKLALLVANKEAIRDAITEKTGEDAGEVMSTYAEKIMGIQTGPEYWRTTILLDQTITDPATMITEVYDDGGIDLIRANSHRYVCKLVDGVMQAKRLQDGNGTLYLDGTTADLTGGEGDVMMKLPQFYYRATEQETDKWLINFVYGGRPSEEYKVWDGKDFIGVYEAYVADSNVYSRSGVAPSANISHPDFKTYARNRGDGYTLVKWKHHCIMAFLFYARNLYTNSQGVIGTGKTSANTGSSDLLGMEDTKSGVNGESQAINFFGLEAWWGNNVNEWIDNVTYNIVASDYTFRIIEDDETTRDVTSARIAGFGSKMVIGENLDLIPSSSTAATENTGFCDQQTTSTGNAGRALIRSYYGTSTYGGVSYLNANNDPSTVAANYGSRLAYRGEYEEFDGVFEAEYSVIGAFSSNGSQYFDTGFNPNQDTRVVIDMEFQDLTVTGFVFGARRSPTSNSIGVFYQLSSKLFGADYITQNNRFLFNNVNPSDRVVIDYDQNICTINGISNTWTEGSYQSPCSLTLLAINTNGTKEAPAQALLYSCQIFDNGVLVRDYVPCVRKADGVSGLWDKVNKTFNTPITIA